MADSELEAIRAQRLAQMQGGGGGGGGNAAAGQGIGQFGGNSAETGQDKQKELEERRNQAEEAKNQMLTQILDQPARARLNTLMLAKHEKGQMVENMLINMARMGQIRGKLGEAELVGLLEQVNEKLSGSKSTKVKFDRRRTALDSDDEDYDL